MRLGIVVNPDAGLGGKLGFKGSDGRAAEARAAGAEDRAGPRMEQCLNHLATLRSVIVEPHRCRPHVGWMDRSHGLNMGRIGFGDGQAQRRMDW